MCAAQLVIVQGGHWQLIFRVQCFRVNDEEVRLMLWDTAGQEEFDAITKAYYRGELPCRRLIGVSLPLLCNPQLPLGSSLRALAQIWTEMWDLIKGLSDEMLN